jgi:hypothetical protein
MDKRKKIIIGSFILAGLITSYYFFIYKNRVPKLKLETFNWNKRSINAKVGNANIDISEFTHSVYNAGKNYNSNFKLKIKPLGRGKVDLIIFDGNEIVEKKQADFDDKLVKNIIQ